MCVRESVCVCVRGCRRARLRVPMFAPAIIACKHMARLAANEDTPWSHKDFFSVLSLQQELTNGADVMLRGRVAGWVRITFCLIFAGLCDDETANIIAVSGVSC